MAAWMEVRSEVGQCLSTHVLFSKDRGGWNCRDGKYIYTGELLEMWPSDVILPRNHKMVNRIPGT